MIGNESPSHTRILCAGSIVLDTIARTMEELRWGTTTFVDTIERHLGGNGANTARALAILGCDVSMLGTVGNDEAGRFALEELRRAGVDVGSVSATAEPNAATVVLVNAVGDRQFLHRLGSSTQAFREIPDFAHAASQRVQHLHLASLFVLPYLRKNASEILRSAKAAGLTTSVDTNWDALGEWIRILLPCLPHADILFLNEDESRMLTGTDDPVQAARWLQERGARTVIQKRGRQGSILCLRGKPEIECAGYPVNAVDSTGAGDCFAAGFLWAWLGGRSLHESGEHGNAAGALSVSRTGSVEGLLSEPDFACWKRSQDELRRNLSA